MKDEQTIDCLTFETRLPDDSEWSQEGDLMVPGGRAIAVVLIELFREAGVNVESVEQQEYYAWLIPVESDGLRLEFYLHDLHPWLLICESQGRWYQLQRKRQKLKVLCERVLTELKERLQSDSRFYDVRAGSRETLL